MSHHRPRLWRIGPWRFDEESGELSSPGRHRRLEPREASVLALLAARAPRLVSREDLLAEVWEGRAVSDSVVWRAVYRLRRALGDDASAPDGLETVPGRGYRLNGAVEEGTPGASAPPGPEPTRRHRRFASLTRLAGVVAVAGASIVLAGGGRSVLDGPRAPADLVRAARALYADDPLALATDPAVAARAGAWLDRAIDQAPGFGAAHAERATVLAVSSERDGSRRKLDQALASARRAVELEPASPAARRGLGLALRGRGEFTGALAELGRALELEPDDELTLQALATLRLDLGDLDQSELLNERLLERRRSAGRLTLRAVLALLRDDRERARRAAAEALDHDPLATSAELVLARLEIFEGRFDDGRQRLARLLAREPRSIGVLVVAGALEEAAGRLDAARRILEAADRIDQETNGELLLRLGVVAHAQGDLDRSQPLLEAILRHGHRVGARTGLTWHRAARYAVAARLLDREAESERWLAAARASGFPFGAVVREDPVWASVLGPSADRS